MKQGNLKVTLDKIYFMNTIELIEKINSIDNILFAYLFGSYANNNETMQSDVDIAVYLQDTSLDSELQINYELSKLLKKDVDLVVLNKSKNMFLLQSILKDGIVLKDGLRRLEYEVVTEHDILDYKAFRKFIDAA